ncbi:MAG: NAD(P)H-binding protein [Gammaproteobacteria bacterium]|nr:NAD(P)H-binding protein [Gammaproteobacteria bacterium]
MKTLVIGGTGPTGPHIVNGLLSRGHQVSILNRGAHDTDEIPAHVERIVGDPHFKETLSDALAGRHFDVIVATYGRIRYVAEVVAEHTDRLITVGGSPGYRGTRQPERLFPEGLQVPLPEDAPKVETEDEFRFGYLARISEDAVMDRHLAGRYVATHLRYPLIYGPRQLGPTEWWIIRRLLDKREHMVLPDGGLTLLSRGYSINMAHAVLLSVDQPENAGGKIFNCADVHQLTMRQWVQTIADTMDAKLDIVSVPAEFAYPSRDLMIRRTNSHHQLFDLHAIRKDLGYEDQVPVLEALQRTVRWYLDNPVEETPEQKAEYAAHYRTEDDMAAIYKDAVARFSKVDFVDKEFSHPYAHPKKPGLGVDHRNR